MAEALAGVNRKSRCVDSANEICQEGQQMITVVRVLYKNTPVMYDANRRFPRQISYLDQAEGLSNTPVLWCVCHLIEIPPVDQITRLLGPLIQPLSQETTNNGSDFEGNRKKFKPTSALKNGKERKSGNILNAASTGTPASKVSKTLRKLSNA